MYFTQVSSWYKIVHSFGHIPVKFHCDGSILWYKQTPTYVKVTTVCMHAWQRWCIHWITFWMLRCSISFCFSIRLWQLRNIYWRWYPVFHAIAHNTLTYPLGDITAGMKGYSITYMLFVCRTFSVKRAVWAGALSCWNTLHRPPRPPHLGDV